MTDIQSLDQATISKIAAGEVVERPASVAKELVENSLDADASRIEVAVSAGGTEEIRVADDGTGMTESAVKKAVHQHTTSKIGSIEDLETGLETLGFRGEALYTIGAVSKMTITTRPMEGADLGTELRVVGGEVVDVAPAGRAPGTTVEVTDLFFNTPARRKYLKNEATEFARLNRVVTRYALANPAVAVSLSHNGNTVFGTNGQGILRETIHSVYGREVAESMIEVEATPAEGVTGVSGYVSEPETTRSGSHYVSTYVNGRYVREGLLREAVLEAYGNQLAPDRYPFVVLFLEVPPETVDVNVHPRKMEVRFDEDETVREAVAEAIREALLDHGLVRSGAPRGRSAPEETEIAPERRSEVEGQAEGKRQADGEQQTEADRNIGDEEAAGQPADTTVETQQKRREAPSEEGWDEDGGHLEGNEPGSPEPEDPERSDSHEDEPREQQQEDSAAGLSSIGSSDSSLGRFWEDEADKFEEGSQADLTTGEPAGDLERDTLPPLSVLGQVQDTYIVAESPDGIVLIDQHAADERIQYERLAAELADRTDSQRLVHPVEVAVTPEEATLFEAAESDLAELGFEGRLEGETVVVEAVPAVFADTLAPELIRDLLSAFLEESRSEAVVESAADELLADMACYPAITGNTSLREGDILGLLEALDACENPYACPHGRPVIIELSASELEDRFERDYPGHATRRREE